MRIPPEIGDTTSLVRGVRSVYVALPELVSIRDYEVHAIGSKPRQHAVPLQQLYGLATNQVSKNYTGVAYGNNRLFLHS